MKPVLFLFVLIMAVHAAEQQNPSPMVEHTREHPRLKEEHPAEKRVKIDAGTLFIPQCIAGQKEAPLLIFMHGGTWIPEIAAAKHGMAALVVQRADGYKALFENKGAFEALLTTATEKAGMSWSQITVGGWSAGCQGIRAMLHHESAMKRIGRVLMIDGIHTSYTDGKPGPLESKIDTDALQPIAAFARRPWQAADRCLSPTARFSPAPSPAPRRPPTGCCANLM